MIMGFQQLRFIQNGIESPNKRLEMPGIEPVNPSLLGLHQICLERERGRRERQTDIQTNTCIYLDRQTDRHTHREMQLTHTKILSSSEGVNMRGSSPPHLVRERSGSVVECLTRDRGAVGSSLTALWSLSKTHLS